MTTIEKIKREIQERLSLQSCFKGEFAAGSRDALQGLLSFLSTLESEKPINPEEAMKELDEKIALVKQRGTWDGVDVDKYMDEVRGREPEKPVPNDLDFEQELYNHFGQVKDFTLGMRIGKYFYELGKHSGSSEIPNDLEEAADEYEERVIEETKCHHNALLTYANGYEDALLLIPGAFIDGAKWQKEQMLKDAVEGEVVQDLKGVNRVKSFGKIPEGLHFGDKVRIIIVKEDEK